MSGLLEGQVALITGAGSGIGRASALRFVDEGAKVAIADISDEGLAETLSLVRESGYDALAVIVDITQAADVKALVERVVSEYGSLTCAFNNAGIEGAKVPTGSYPDDAWDQVMAVNLRGTFLCVKHEVQQMASQGNGSIVNMASGAALVGRDNMSAYTASKHGIVGLTKATALEYASLGIRVNALCPYAVATPMIERLIETEPELRTRILERSPIGRLAAIDEVASVAAWLCSSQSSYVTGHAMTVDGGFTAR